MTLADSLEECRRIRMDLTAAQAKLTDVINAIAAHPDSNKPRPQCPSCGTYFRGELALAEHEFNTHNGPVPTHYLAAEQLAGIQAGGDGGATSMENEQP